MFAWCVGGLAHWLRVHLHATRWSRPQHEDPLTVAERLLHTGHPPTDQKRAVMRIGDARLSASRDVTISI